MLTLCRPALGSALKILYFHENQLAYPSQNKCASGQASWSLAWNQIISCVAADRILWNSNFNLSSFLDAIPRFLSKIPSVQRPYGSSKELCKIIKEKSSILFFPLSHCCKTSYNFPEVRCFTTFKLPNRSLSNYLILHRCMNVKVSDSL